MGEWCVICKSQPLLVLFCVASLQVMPFVQANISRNTAPEDWRLREAATFAFGLILDGPEPKLLLDTVKQGLAYLLQALKVCTAAASSTAQRRAAGMGSNGLQL